MLYVYHGSYYRLSEMLWKVLSGTMKHSPEIGETYYRPDNTSKAHKPPPQLTVLNKEDPRPEHPA